jgi:hypothetical protein
MFYAKNTYTLTKILAWQKGITRCRLVNSAVAPSPGPSPGGGGKEKYGNDIVTDFY